MKTARKKLIVAAGKIYVVCSVFAFWVYVIWPYSKIVGFIVGAVAGLFAFLWMKINPYDINEQMQTPYMWGNMSQTSEAETEVSTKACPLKKEAGKNVPGISTDRRFTGPSIR